MAQRIHPAIKSMQLEFEHNSLREITITFKDSLAISRVRDIFQLPANRQGFPENVQEIGYGENIFSKRKPVNPAYTIWLTITGFDHMGSADMN